MVWAQKSMSVLAVGMSFVSATLPFGPALMIEHRTLEDAEAALASSTYSVMVMDATGQEERAKRLVEYARALHPGIRIIFAARRSPSHAPVGGEVLLAANGRQFVRGLRHMLGC